MRLALALALASSALLIASPQIVRAQDDADSDGVPNVDDNCDLVPNPPPFDCDTDEDGFGNRCDADFDQDFDVDISDYAQRFYPDYVDPLTWKATDPPLPSAPCSGFDCVPLSGVGATNVALDGTNLDCSGDGPVHVGSQISTWPMGSVNAADAAIWWELFVNPALLSSGLACAGTGTPGCCTATSCP